jgi:purine nucleosidase
VIAHLLQPALFHARHINVGIETKGEFTLGMTVDDWWRVKKRELNAMVIGGVDREGFYRLLSERLGGCEEGGTKRNYGRLNASSKM